MGFVAEIAATGGSVVVAGAKGAAVDAGCGVVRGGAGRVAGVLPCVVDGSACARPVV